MAKVLIVGNGAREHAICRQFLKSEHVETVYCAPGNPGMKSSNVVLVPINEMAFDELIDFAKINEIDLTVVGPEVPLQAGIVDCFMRANLKIFGPTKNAARLESSKIFAKEQMKRAQIPTAAYQTFSSELKAIEYLKQINYPIVIKSDGLAAGKGVVIAADAEMAMITIHEMLGESKFGAQEVVIEEYLVGQEFSFFSFVNGNQVIPMPIAQDHKAAYDGDLGPNTGGMGAYSPVPQISQEIITQTLVTIIQPIVETMAAQGNSFCGILYTGLIVTDAGPKVIEFNVRFGDPETSVVLPQLKTDFYELLINLLNQESQLVEWQSDQTFLCIDVASENYPQRSGSGVNLENFMKTPKEIEIDFAGTKQVNRNLVSSGGRILNLVTMADNVKIAQKNIYHWLDQQSIDGLRYRHDIGNKALSNYYSPSKEVDK